MKDRLILGLIYFGMLLCILLMSTGIALIMVNTILLFNLLK